LRFESFDEYLSHFQRLINLEREEEMRKHMEEIRKLSGKRREKLGRTILNLSGKFVGRGLGGAYLVKFSRRDMPDTEISVGDVVLVSMGKPTPKSPQATVYEKGKRYIIVYFAKKPPTFVYGRGIRLDLYANDITFQRMLDALHILKIGNFYDLRLLLLGKKVPEILEVKELSFDNKRLNEIQRKAVKRIVASNLFLVHGPPGTGKTTTLVEGIIQLVRRGEKILATADSNVAVDNLVEKLAHKVSVVRVGHPARISKSIIENSLDFLVSKEAEYKKAVELWNRIDELKNEQSKFRKPTPQWRRGLGDEEIIYLANSSRSYRGVPVQIMKDMAQWLKIQRRIDELAKKAKSMENRAIKRILSKADVICTTNSTAGSEVLKDFHFDTVFIDEATQSVEPSCLISILKGNKIVMAGDHKQLPPTVMSFKARDLQITLFERWIEMYPHISLTLRVQYRMNEKIMLFPSKKFYNSLLEAHKSVKNHTLQDLNIKCENKEIWDIINPENVVVFVDTKGKCQERQRRGSTSYENPCEAQWVERIVDSLLNCGLKTKHIGVITPYDDQVELLRSLLPIDGLEIKSVDGFQGREKEVIVISFVRSNEEGDIGFLSDLRRLNVAITRAKRKLIMVGDSITLSHEDTYRDLLEYVDKYGKVLRVD